MAKGPDICALCAWRETCQKKFSISGRDMRCPDFSRDVSVGDDHRDSTAGAEEAETKKKK
jgi:hypothetical protein